MCVTIKDNEPHTKNSSVKNSFISRYVQFDHDSFEFFSTAFDLNSLSDPLGATFVFMIQASCVSDGSNRVSHRKPMCARGTTAKV